MYHIWRAERYSFSIFAISRRTSPSFIAVSEVCAHLLKGGQTFHSSSGWTWGRWPCPLSHLPSTSWLTLSSHILLPWPRVAIWAAWHVVAHENRKDGRTELPSLTCFPRGEGGKKKETRTLEPYTFFTSSSSTKFQFFSQVRFVLRFLALICEAMKITSDA